MKELEYSLTTGTYVKPNKVLKRESQVKRQTLETYRWLVKTHILPVLGGTEFGILTPMQIQ
jgi:integrase